MLLVHYDIINQAMIIQPVAMTTEQKIKHLSDKMRWDMEKMDIRFIAALVIKSNDAVIMQCEGVATDQNSNVWVKAKGGGWSPVLPNLVFGEVIIDALTERIKLLYGGN